MDTNAQIKREGTIKITDTETGEVTISATYAAADILAALDKGESIESIIARCEGVEQKQISPDEISALRGNRRDPLDCFPFGM